MPRPMKVWTWQGFREGKCTREMCAEPSFAALKRKVGDDRISYYFNLGETGNAADRELALANPGVLYWRPIDDRGDWRLG